MTTNNTVIINEEVLAAIESELQVSQYDDRNRLNLSDYLVRIQLALQEASYLHINPSSDYQTKMPQESIREIAALAIEALTKFGSPMRTEMI